MKVLLPVIIITLLFTSCFKLENSAEGLHVDDIALADVDFKKSILTLGREGKDPITIEAESIKWFEDENRVIVGALTLKQSDSNGKVIIKGNAGSAKIDTKNMLVDLKDGVHLIKEDDNMEIEAESILLDTENSIVKSDGKVVIHLEEGYFEGSGLEANLNSMTLELKSIEKGAMYEK
ncbi:MAG: LPS export ABC transporter periplasmic protein LptC [Sphaerochaetaceae bacterium]|nr:LPS export ABC transporter periplasmic protein LptC [Sphaerochaetaceae bacterium]